MRHEGLFPLGLYRRRCVLKCRNAFLLLGVVLAVGPLHRRQACMIDAGSECCRGKRNRKQRSSADYTNARRKHAFSPPQKRNVLSFVRKHYVSSAVPQNWLVLSLR